MIPLTQRQTNNVSYVDSICFKEMDPKKDIPKDATITIVGKRRMGKSELMRNLAYNLKDNFAKVYLLSGTSTTQLGFWDFVPEENIIKGLDEEKLQQIFKEQELMILRESEKGNKDKSTMPHVLLILDDLIKGTSGLRNSDFLTNIYCNGRHYCVCCVLAVQSFKSVNPTIRDNTDVSIAFKFKNGDTVEDFVKENFTVCNIDSGRRIMEKITCCKEKPYQCIVVLSHLRTNETEELVKTYTAETKLPKFVIGAKRKTQDLFIPKVPIFKKKQNKKYAFFDPDEY